MQMRLPWRSFRSVAGLQQLAQGFAAGIGDDRYGLERRQHGRIAVRLGLLHRPFHPLDVREVDAVIMLQQAADPDSGGHGVELDADALALEVLPICRRPPAARSGICRWYWRRSIRA